MLMMSFCVQILLTFENMKFFCHSAVTPGTTQGPVFRTSGFTLAGTCHIDLGNVHEGKHTMSQVSSHAMFLKHFR